MTGLIFRELKNHAPFTLLGAVTGIAIMFLFVHIPHTTALNIFYVLHPIHVLLSALVTTSMYKLHKSGEASCNLPILLIVGFTGSIGIATISDSLIPYLGEVMLNMPARALSHWLYRKVVADKPSRNPGSHHCLLSTVNKVSPRRARPAEHMGLNLSYNHGRGRYIKLAVVLCRLHLPVYCRPDTLLCQ